LFLNTSSKEVPIVKPVILCVDDEKIVLDILNTVLKYEFTNECTIELAENAMDGLELIDSFIEQGKDVAAVIADFRMPGMKGDEFLICVHQLLPETLKILLTGQIGFEGLTNVVSKLNLYRYIAKPWDNIDLTLTVREALHSYLQRKTIKIQNNQLQY